MRNYFFFTILILCSTRVFSVESVRLKTDVDLVVNGTSAPYTIALTSEKPTGDGNVETAPGKVYLPIQKDDLDTKTYFIDSTLSSTPSIFSATNTSHVFNLPLRVNTGGVGRYLYAAVKNASNAYIVVKNYGSLITTTGTEGTDVVFSLSPAAICTAIATSCTNLAPASTTEVQVKALVYYFLSNQTSYNYGVDSVTVTDPPYNTGIYFEVNMSNQVSTDSDLRISIESIRAGDKRLTLKYTATTTLGSIAKSVRVFKHATSSPGVQNGPIGDYDGVLIAKEFSYAQNSEVVVSELENSVPVTFSILFMDKYRFGTTLSGDKTGVPLEIAELLKKNACFLLTAGFGEDHFVINYFRHFRDTVLMNSFLGKKFVSVYYELAPRYALMIYQHDSMRAMIRGGAYVLYFIFNYFALIFLSIALLLPGIYLYKNKDKIKI